MTRDSSFSSSASRRETLPISLRYMPMESLIAMRSNRPGGRNIPSGFGRPAVRRRVYDPPSHDGPRTTTGGARVSDQPTGGGAPTGGDVIVLERVRKEFGSFVAVELADFSIARGEFFSLLGPSGCGKTTLLKMIAGFELPTSGRVLLEGVDVSNVAPAQAQRQHRLPAVRAVPAHVGARQRRLRPAGQEGAIGRGPQAVAGDARRRPPRRVRGPPAEPAVRWPATARRPGQGPGQPPERPAPRRAARRPRPQAPRGHAAGAQADPARGRDHVHLRDPRPG